MIHIRYFIDSFKKLYMLCSFILFASFSGRRKERWKMTILLVDDNDINLFALEKLLHSSGFENCVKLSSAQDLFDYLNKPNKQMEVDLILLDVMMPNIDGIEACKRIRENESFNNIQIIFVTALEDKLRLAEALDIGGNDYVSKPIDKTELLARIRVALRLKKELDWHTAYDRKIEKELTLASEVQRNLLSRPIQNDDIQIAVSYMPSAKLAGDMYYWHKIDDNKYAVILIDMMGHGISASLVCMYISSILHEAIKTIRDPELVMRELNRHMALLPTKEDEIPYYFTAIYFIIDTSKKTLEYVNAGHPACYVKIDDAPSSTLDSNALPIGFLMKSSLKKRCYIMNIPFNLFY